MAAASVRTGIPVRKCLCLLSFSISLLVVPFQTRASDDSSASGFTCVPRPDVDVPQRDAPGEESAASGISVCPHGQVPQPNPRFSNKGRPGLSMFVDDSAPYYYYYADAFQYSQGVGAFAQISQHQPALGRRDYHSLAEMAVGSNDGAQLVEVGWNVDPSVNGDTLSHLFVFSWIDHTPQCYDGCGWVQVSSTRYPGMVVETSSSTSQQSYAILYVSGKWWVGYQGEWIGYYPASLWNEKFTQIGISQWFGEVSTSRGRTCGDMGSGQFADSSSSAVMSTLSIIRSDGSMQSASPTLYQSRESYYDVEFESGKLRYGGPGGC